MRNHLINGMLAVIATVLTFSVCETAYRLFLYVKKPEYFVQTAHKAKSISFFSDTMWEFDREVGYRYPANARLISGSIEDGRLGPCGVGGLSDMTSKEEVRTRYANAELKVLVVGDSMTALVVNGRTWPDFLQGELERRLNKKVQVVNFAVDGIGILQMFDVASVRIAEWKPDLAIIAFITDDITRARIWRQTAMVNGRLRLFTSIRPDVPPDLAHSVDTVVLAPEATLEWCNKSPRPDRKTDPLVREIELRNRIAVEHAQNRADLFALDHSYLIERIRTGTPFRHINKPHKLSVNPRHELARFSDDDRLRNAVESIARSSVPILIVHLATRSELRHGKEYIFNEENRQMNLLRSLEDMTHSKITNTLDHLSSPIENVEGLGMSATDDHPSEYGMKIYGNLVAEAVIRRKLTGGGTVTPSR